MEHVVRPGETLSGIAEAHGVELERLMKLNPAIQDENVISVGDAIRLPRNARLAEASTSYRGRSAGPADEITWHVLPGSPLPPPGSSPFWMPARLAVAPVRREPEPRQGKRRTFRTSRIRKRWIAERQEAAQTAVDALPGPHAGVVWRCLEPLRLASRAAASAYGLLAGLLHRSESASVGDGDTLWEHAARSGLSIRELQRGNRLRSDVIRSGQRLRYSGEQGFLQAVLFPAPALRRAWARLLLPVRVSSPVGDPMAYLSSAFGPRYGTFHCGMDISAEARLPALLVGEPVIAAADGVITFTGTDGTYGLRVEIAHGGAVTTAYAHCASLLRVPGERVARGDPIGVMGETGSPDGPHVHFEVRRFGQPVDPYWVTEGIP